MQTMNIELTETMGIEQATLDIEGLGTTLISGENASGKTSIATALRAVFAHDANPLGVSSGAAGQAYRRDGSDQARVKLSGKYLSKPVDVVWDVAGMTIQCPPDHERVASPEVVGLEDFVGRATEHVRMARWEHTLLTDAQKRSALTDLIKQIRTAVPEAEADAVVQQLSGLSDAATAEAVYGDRAREAKRRWAAIAGSSYGVKKAADWLPPDWLAQYDSLTDQTAEAAVVAARERHTEVAGHAAATVGECPHCGEEVVAVGGEILVSDDYDETVWKRELDKAAVAVDEAVRAQNAVKSRADAQGCHQTVDAYTRIAKQLGPTGVRAEMVRRGIDTLNSGLRRLRDEREQCQPEVQVDDGGSVHVNGRPALVCSESERWWAQFVIQLELSGNQPAVGNLIVVDRADVLGPRMWDELMWTLDKMSGTKIICGTHIHDRPIAGNPNKRVLRLD